MQSKWCSTSQRRIGKIGSWERRRVGARGARCEKIDGMREGEGKRCRCNISLQLTALVRLWFVQGPRRIGREAPRLVNRGGN